MVDKFPAEFLEKYEPGRVIGEGNFSIVKECVRRDDGVKFAVKCVNKNALNPKDRSNLKQEIKILCQLDHPNIIKLFDVYEDNHGMVFLVLEFAEGGELFDRIISKEYYSEAEAKKVVRCVAKVLDYCHSRGISHRDLKPENLLYEDDNPTARLKIADFGFAKVATPDRGMSTMCGTPGYYAPEIIRKEAYDSKCDIWSLGVITYILLCGFPPFYDENQNEEMRKILHSDFEFVSPYFDGISRQAKDLITRMLVVNAKKRLSVKEVLNHPWLKDCDDDDGPMLQVGKNMVAARKLTARNKFRAGVGAVLAVTKTKRLLGLRQKEAQS